VGHDAELGLVPTELGVEGVDRIVTVCGRSLLLSMPRRFSSTRFVLGDKAIR
jgi:hypothetical protein